MATAILYTTVEAIRSCIGLDSSDMPDEIITSQNLKGQFTLDLMDWYTGNFESDWASGGFDPTETPDPEVKKFSSAEKKAYLLSSYSMWFGAYRTLETFLSVPMVTKDGKNEIRRFDKLDFEAIIARVRGNMALARKSIEDELNSSSVPVTATILVENATYDIITGS